MTSEKKPVHNAQMHYNSHMEIFPILLLPEFAMNTCPHKLSLPLMSILL